MEHLLQVLLPRALDGSVSPEDIYAQLPADIRGHCDRVAAYVAELAREAAAAAVYPQDGLPEEEIEQAARFHDIGKALMPAEILYKPDTLSDLEWSIMKQHTSLSATFFEYCLDRAANEADRRFWQTAKEMAVSHHERWDGRGYPEGRKGAQTPFFARLCGIADMYDAMTSPRPYREAMPPDMVCNEILRSAGTHFDPVLIGLFRDSMARRVINGTAGGMADELALGEPPGVGSA